MSVNAQAYVTAAKQAIDRVVVGNGGEVSRAAELIASALRAGGVLQAFGTGHSEALAMELCGRAGGLVPTNKISLRDVVLFGDAPREVLHDEKLERDPALAQRLYELAAPQPRDVFVVASNSGINGCIVEFALLVKRNSHLLIAITSAEHTARVTPRHPSGLRLAEIADVVLDNGAPYGDALLPLPGGGTVGAISSITSALLGQLVSVEVVRQLQAAGEVPPIYLSANVPGGDEHNLTLESRYAGRIRRTA
ncbi:sugar isomerase domain-containing protein [Rugosimonospora acidiphila]|uniref:Sugar isomerase domain-containing protein n=1 Tax=Rugosimonospora acidiphila TaxID=556531 RepID=A0ABP9S6S4_9ACTN